MRNVITLQATSHNNGSEVTPTMTVDDDSAFLTTPAQVEDSSDISTSFIFPSRSYDVQVRSLHGRGQAVTEQRSAVFEYQGRHPRVGR